MTRLSWSQLRGWLLNQATTAAETPHPNEGRERAGAWGQTHVGPECGCFPHFAAPPRARALGGHMPTPSQHTRCFPGLMRRGPETVASERGRRDEETCLRGEGPPHSPRPSPAPSPTAGARQAGRHCVLGCRQRGPRGAGRSISQPGPPPRTTGPRCAPISTHPPYPRHAPV